MKKLRLLTIFMLSIFTMTAVTSTFAAKKEKKVCILNVEMDCGSCAKKVKKGLRFEKGIKKLKVDIKKQTVAITYRADKTTPEKLLKAVKKLGYKASISKVGEHKAHKHGSKCNHKHDHGHDHKHDGHDHKH